MFDVPLLFLIFGAGPISFSRPVPIRSAQATVSRRGTGRGGPQVCRTSDVFRISCPEGGRGRPRHRSGRLECMSGRQFARTGGGGGSSKPWDIQQADKSIRVRNAGERLLPRPGSSNDLARWTEPLPVCRYLSNGVRDARLAGGRPRKRPFAKRSARSLSGEKEQQTTGLS